MFMRRCVQKLQIASMRHKKTRPGSKSLFNPRGLAACKTLASSQSSFIEARSREIHLRRLHRHDDAEGCGASGRPILVSTSTRVRRQGRPQDSRRQHAGSIWARQKDLAYELDVTTIKRPLAGCSASRFATVCGAALAGRRSRKAAPRFGSQAKAAPHEEAARANAEAAPRRKQPPGESLLNKQ